MLILPRQELRDKVLEFPNKYNAIIIGASEIELIGLSSFCRDSHISLFADVVNSSQKGAPTYDKVKDCIEWGKDKEELLISCAAGISRSSAIAYLIECANSNNPEASVNILDVHRHRPNQLILCYGSQILGQDVVNPIFEIYKFALEQKTTDIGLKFYLKDLDVIRKKMI